MIKPLIILDVDQTLIFATKERLNKEPDFIVFDYNVYKRPSLIYLHIFSRQENIKTEGLHRMDTNNGYQ